MANRCPRPSTPRATTSRWRPIDGWDATHRQPINAVLSLKMERALCSERWRLKSRLEGGSHRRETRLRGLRAESAQAAGGAELRGAAAPPRRGFNRQPDWARICRCERLSRRGRSMAELMSLREAIGAFVMDGATVAMEG